MKKGTSNMLFGILLFLFSVFMIIDTAVGNLRPNARIVPCMAFLLIGIGGALIAFEEIKAAAAERKKSGSGGQETPKKEKGEDEHSWAAAAVVLVFLVAYSMLMPILGLFTTTALFLACWWTFCGHLLRHNRAFKWKSSGAVILQAGMHAVPAALILYVIFVLVLKVYIPNVLLL